MRMKELLISELKRYARKFPNTVKFMLDNYTGNLRCRRCGSLVFREPEIKHYPYQCLHCDENMFSFEVKKSDKPVTVCEVEDLVCCALGSLGLDEDNELYFVRKHAARLLISKNTLLGYELEDGELDRTDDKEIKQFMIRPITGVSFDELWNHGKQHCSKYTIYLNCDEVFTERRPDLLNYQVTNDLMYGKKDIVAAGREYNDFVRKSFRNTEKEYAGYLNLHRELLSKRIKWAIDHLVEIKELGKGRFNILYEEC